MRVLVIDTALGACTVAVFQDDVALAIRTETMIKGHQERLGGFVRDAVAEAGGGFQSLDRIGVTVGPGSFTGLRVGLAFAQGLGAALDRPVVGISTLSALARTVDGGLGRTAAVVDARRGQVYLQTFEDGRPLCPPLALAIDAAMTALGDGPWRWAGNGVALVHADGGRVDADVTPQALAALSISADPVEARPRPLYLRAPDATPPTRLPGQPRQVLARPVVVRD